jgi:hypothetical protein
MRKTTKSNSFPIEYETWEVQAKLERSSREVTVFLREQGDESFGGKLVQYWYFIFIQFYFSLL